MIFTAFLHILLSFEKLGLSKQQQSAYYIQNIPTRGILSDLPAHLNVICYGMLLADVLLAQSLKQSYFSSTSLNAFSKADLLYYKNELVSYQITRNEHHLRAVKAVACSLLMMIVLPCVILRILELQSKYEVDTLICGYLSFASGFLNCGFLYGTWALGKLKGNPSTGDQKSATSGTGSGGSAASLLDLAAENAVDNPFASYSQEDGSLLIYCAIMIFVFSFLILVVLWFSLFSSGSASGVVDGGVSGRLSIFDTKLMISSLPLTSYMSPVAELTRYTAALFPMKLPSMSSESVQSVTQVLSRYMMLALTSKLNTFRRVAANTNVSIVGK
jgi:hypothetical protein